MLNDAQMKIFLKKMKRLESTYQKYLFEKIGDTSIRFFQTKESLYDIPPKEQFSPAKEGDRWGGENVYGWFQGEYTVPAEYDGRTLFLHPNVGGWEALYWLDGAPAGLFAYKLGNHAYNVIAKKANAGETIAFDLEFYAGHYVPGCSPFETAEPSDFLYTMHSLDVCVRDDLVNDFYLDLVIVNQLANSLPAEDFRRANAETALLKVFDLVYQSPEDVSKDTWRSVLPAAKEALAPVLAAKSSDNAAIAGFIGHSHMDTAWLWHIGETVKKCARTYSNQINLMDRYPEHRFIQSSACHSDFIREHYPKLFEAIRQKVAEGRYEPNGGVWVECDCNITGGEAMIRQFLWGQAFTKKYFNYLSDSFWLPDTFGYSAAIPQIMKGCGIDYFLTTKITWNDTTVFPYDTFWWEGMDGTKVMAHFNLTHVAPDAKCMIEQIQGSGHLKNKRTNNRRLAAYGPGDGGGGPTYEMIEMSRRVADLDGAGKSYHTTVSDFMHTLEATSQDVPVHTGELYLELHRGTLTNMHQIKRNNRKVEIALRNLELLTVLKALRDGQAPSDEKIRPLLQRLLINQFHDILPGSSIARVHDESIADTTGLLKEINALIAGAGLTENGNGSVTLFNPLSFDRSDCVYLECDGMVPADDAIRSQTVTDLDGKTLLCLAGVTVPAMAAVTIAMKPGAPGGASAFCWDGNKLDTPFAEITFDETGYMTSLFDKTACREIRGEGHPLNALLMGEDVAWDYDNWNLDADFESKLTLQTNLISRIVVADGPVQLRIRSQYKIGMASTLTQDMIFYADSPKIDFDTVIAWHDKHQFLKAGFATNILAGAAKNEVQFGYIERPVTRNNPLEQAKFEVCNHKYTDLSESRYGVAVLNDCKYGVSVKGGDIRLSLHKGGCRPDTRGDAGLHRVTYSLLPHNSGFDAKHVVQPAYELNNPTIAYAGQADLVSLMKVSADNVIVEAVKPCESGEKAFVVRLYEAERTHTNCTVTLPFAPAKVEETDMLERTKTALNAGESFTLSFRPFEIKTLKIYF